MIVLGIAALVAIHFALLIAVAFHLADISNRARLLLDELISMQRSADAARAVSAQPSCGDAA